MDLALTIMNAGTRTGLYTESYAGRYCGIRGDTGRKCGAAGTGEVCCSCTEQRAATGRAAEDCCRTQQAFDRAHVLLCADYAPPTPSITLPVPPQCSHFFPYSEPLPLHFGQMFSPVPGVPAGA